MVAYYEQGAKPIPRVVAGARSRHAISACDALLLECVGQGLLKFTVTETKEEIQKMASSG